MHNQYITPAEKMQEPERLHDLRPNGTERPWAKWKREAQGLADIYEVLGCDPDNPQAAHDLDKARRVSECANYTEFQRHDPDGQHSGPWLTLHTANFCRNRLCPMCGWRRSLKLGSQAREVVAEANRQKVSRDGVAYKWLLVTFTVKNVTGPELGRTIDQLHKAAHNMAKTKRWKAAVKGWLRATEVTHNTDVKSASFDTFHPHLHFLLCVNSRYFKSADYIPQKEWKAMWERAAGLSYDAQVNVKAVKDLENDPTKESKTSLGGALAEVTKYVCKPQGVVTWENPEMAVRTVLVLDRMLDGRRLTSWGGVLKEAAAKLKLDSIENGDLVHVESESEDKDANAIADYVAFNWSVGVSDYLKFYDRQGKAPEVEKAIKADTAHKVNAKRAKSAAEGGRAKVRNDIIRRATREDSDEWKEIHLGEIDLQDIFGG
jgi:plasmid rolling circle replication initiator protein Rep